jgi:phage gp16-like protein
MEDMGYEVDVIVHVDSTSAKSISSRAGLGKVRHMEVRLLWIQEAVRNKRIQMWKIKGENNPADILTKPMSLKEMRSNEKLDRVNFTQPEKVNKKSWADMTAEEFGER